MYIYQYLKHASLCILLYGFIWVVIAECFPLRESAISIMSPYGL